MKVDELMSRNVLTIEGEVTYTAAMVQTGVRLSDRFAGPGVARVDRHDTGT